MRRHTILYQSYLCPGRQPSVLPVVAIFTAMHSTFTVFGSVLSQLYSVYVLATRSLRDLQSEISASTLPLATDEISLHSDIDLFVSSRSADNVHVVFSHDYNMNTQISMLIMTLAKRTETSEYLQDCYPLFSA
jgi:hypothetical protein